MPDTIIVHDPETWPNDLHQFLNERTDLIAGWECSTPRTTDASQYDSFIYELRDILRRYSVQGCHWTKLTTFEIEDIKNNGMLLQDLRSLESRIDRLVEQNVINADIAQRLKMKTKQMMIIGDPCFGFAFLIPLLLAKKV